MMPVRYSTPGHVSRDDSFFRASRDVLVFGSRALIAADLGVR